MTPGLLWKVQPFTGSCTPPLRLSARASFRRKGLVCTSQGSTTSGVTVDVASVGVQLPQRVSSQTPAAKADVLRKCSVLANELHISVQQAVKMVSNNRKVLDLKPYEVRKRCEQLRQLLGLNSYEASALLVQHPLLLLQEGGGGAPGLEEVARKARQLCAVLGVPPASMMNALCRLSPDEQRTAMGMSSDQVEHQIRRLQEVLYPRGRAAGVHGAPDGAGAEVAAARRKTIVRTFLVRWPSLIVIPVEQVARNMSALVRMFRQPARRVTILAARVPLLLTLPHTSLRKKVEELRELLQLDEEEVVKVLIAYPLVLRREGQELRDRVLAVGRLLGVAQDMAAAVVRREPNLLRYVPSALSRKIKRLSDGMRVSWNVVAALITLHPPYLLTSPQSLMAKVADLGLVLNIPAARVIQMTLRFPRLLSYDVGKMRQNYEALSSLMPDFPTLTQLVVQHPWMLRLPNAYINNRTAALSALLSLPQPQVISMIALNPVFLAKPMASIQATFDVIVQELGVSSAIASAAIHRAPILLAYDTHTCRIKCQRLSQLASTHPMWQQRLQTLLPDEVDQCVRYGEDTWQRLGWVVEAGLQEQVSFLDHLVMDHHKFLRVFPGFDRRATALRLVMQQQEEEEARRGPGEDNAASSASDAAAKSMELQQQQQHEDVVSPQLSRWSSEDEVGMGEGEGAGIKVSAPARGRQRPPGGRKWVGGRPDMNDF